ncbi:MAG: helix-turn-helix domain-containing protein [Coriobacteriaceae bacterium]|nr:MAG: helix-turn-helix domain-containing protein [Coriobacteriaceae bacterium]
MRFSVSALAASARVSASECLRCFRTLAGSTPMRYVGVVRPPRACELLTSTDLMAAEVAARCGYRDPGHFARQSRNGGARKAATS